MIELWAFLIVIIATIIGAFGSLYFKIGSEKLSRNLRKNLENRDLIKGVIFYAISTIFYIIALKGGELSVIYPLVATSYIWVSFLSVKFLKERMNFWKWLGIILIISGVSFIGFGSV